LKESKEKEKEVTREIVFELKEQGKNLREISNELGISHMTVSRILKAERKCVK